MSFQDMTTQPKQAASAHGLQAEGTVMRLFRLLPLIAIFVLGALTVGRAQPALATLNTFTVSTPTAGVGQQVTAHGSLLNIPSNSTITITATNGFFTSTTTTTVGGGTVIGFGTPTLSVLTTAPIGVATFTGVWVCQTPGTTTFTLTQSPAATTAPSTLTATLACTAIATTPPTQATSAATTVNGTCNAPGQILTATGKGAFTTAPSLMNMDVVSPSTATCRGPGPFTVSYACSMDGIVTFNMLTNPAVVSCSGTANPYTPVNQFCPMYNAVAPYGGGVAFPGTAPYTGSPFPYGYDGALNQTSGLPYAYGFAPTTPFNPAAPFNGVTYPPNYQSVVPYTGLTYPNGYNPAGTTPGLPNPGVPNYTYNPLAGGFVPNGAPVGTGTNYCPPNPPTDVALSTSSPTVACGGNSLIEILVRDAAGLPVANGQKVTLTTTLGTMNPATAVTTNGKVEAKFLAPKTGSGTATITVVATSLSTGDVQNTTSVNVDCPAAATAMPTPAPFYTMPALMPPSTGQGGGGLRITPPNTGDAGLVEALLRDD